MRKQYLLVIILILMHIPTYGYSQNLQTEVRNIFPFSENQLFQGLYGDSSYYFNIAENWKVLRSSYVDIIFSHSSLQNGHDSNITVALNDFPLNSVVLTSLNEHESLLRTYLKPEFLQTGFNKITVSTMQIISEHSNPSRFTPANWLYVHKNSLLHLEFQREVQPIVLSSFPESYLQIGSENPINCAIIIPDQPDDQVYNAALTIAAHLGQEISHPEKGPKIIPYHNFNNTVKTENLILVGVTAEPFISGFLTKFGYPKSSKPGTIILKILNSPWNPEKRVLIISGVDSAGVLSAARMMSNRDLVPQLTTADFEDKIPETKMLKVKKNLGDLEQISLADLEMGDLKFAGVFNQQLSFSIVRPGSQEISGGAFFELNFTHSEAIDFSKSVMTVYLNGFPLRTINLTAETATDGNLRVDIPAKFNKTTAFNFTISFFLNLTNVDSFSTFSQTAWAVIKDSSYLYLPHRRSKDVSLDKYPDIFNETGVLKDLLVVLPDQPTPQELELTGSILELMSAPLAGVPQFETVSASKIDKAQKKKNLLVIGIPKRNKFIREINPKLGIGFTKSFNRLESKEKSLLLKPLAEKAGLIEVQASPFDKNKKLLLISGTNEDFFLLTNKVLLNPIQISQFKGNAVLVNLKGDQFSFDFNDLSNRYGGDEFENRDQKQSWLFNVNTILFIILFLGMTVVLGMIAFTLLRRRKREIGL